MARTGIEHGREFELRGGPDAVLLLHGLTGSTFEMHVVARRLAEQGMRCLAPVMAGHGGEARDLLGVPWPEWVAKARRDLARLEGARRTFVVGCSMGALVACALAHDHPERVDGLVLLAPALELQLHGRLAALLGRHAPLSRLVVPKTAGSDVSDPEQRERNRVATLEGVPLAAVAQLRALADHVDRQLPGIAAPALVVAGAHDHTVTVAGARRLARRIGSGPAHLVVLPDSFHLVGIDVERDLCADEAARFLEGLPVPGARAAGKPRPKGRARKDRTGGTSGRGQGRRPRAR
ncbi:carboxylesterase [Anaeromyxobacter sp. Fw109-5]|uniref:alpha/beta hydrolase n=1 Tax=Anaeromyxobacter sp. (strain Fw109-5) TaxID=404589 RepID=UPI0000ED70FA|nr:alpha/beta fold hydrolase [Anaeromyxobacter sp. Fw109-5]ABS27748.1 alpha/beta hydrolase fold [Anaeromyxobacter sp. Fw109-5]